MAQITDSGKVYSVDADHPFVLYGQLSLGWFGLGGFATLDEAVAAIPGHSLIVHFQLYDENTERYVWTGLRSGDRAVRREYHTLAVRDEGDDHDTLIHVYTCPHCGADVDKSDDICPACHKVTDPQADYRLVGVPVDGGLVQLTRVRYDATDCPACGHPNHEGRVCECCDEQGNLCCCDRQEQSSAMPAHDDEGVY